MRKAKAIRHYSLSSGRLLSLFGASVLSCGGAQLAYATQQNQIKPGPAIVINSSKRKAAPPTQAEMPKSQYGDVTISGAYKADGDLVKGTVHWVGPHTEIEVPDKASKSVLTVHADDIQGSRSGATNLSLIVLSGNVRYRLVQKTEAGERILEGTAGHAVLRRSTQHIEFTGGVHAKLTDPARFSGPALLRTGSLNVAMETKPFRYNLAGDAANNDILFTPLQASAPKADGKPVAPTPVGAVHIFGFRTGELQFGKSIHVQGPGTTGDFASPDQKTAWHLEGDAFEGEFVPDESDLQRATVKENVRFHLLQPSADKKTQTTVDGTASQVSYVRTQAGQETVLHWPIKITYVDPVHLEEPGLLTAGQGATLTLIKCDDGFSYNLDDPNGTQHIHFIPKPIIPKPTEAKEPKPAVPPVPK